MPRLILKKKAEIVREFDFPPSKQAVFVGTNPDNDIVVLDKRVSMRHLKIELKKDTFYLEDLESAFGTHLNGRQIETPVKLANGDLIIIGEYTIEFELTPILEKHKSEQSFEVIGETATRTSEGLANGFSHQTNGASMSGDEFYEFDEISDSSSLLGGIADGNFSQKPKSYYLLSIYGPYTGKRFALKQGETRIGRDNSLNDIVIRNNEQGSLDPSISRRHATISYQNGTFVVSDKRSKTRTYVNQIKIGAEDTVPVYEGDEIEVVSDQKSTIFRMLADGDYDISPPRKSGIWWIRNQLKAGFIGTIVFGILTITAIGLSCGARSGDGNGPDKLQLNKEAWAVNSEPAEPSEGEAGYHLAIGELTRSGEVDVVYGSPASNLVVLSGRDKKQIWRDLSAKLAPGLPVVLADLNSNGLQDVLIVSQDSRLRAFDGANNGAEIWLSPILGGGISTPPAVADLNGDGLKDVVICAQDGQIHIGYGDVVEMNWQVEKRPHIIRSVPTIADLDGNGIFEAFVGTEDGKVLIINGKTGRVVTVFDLSEEVSKATGDYVAQHSVRTPLAFADINGNGILDFVVGATSGNYLAIEGNTLARIWHDSLPHEISQAGPLAPAFGHLNTDEIPDAILISAKAVKVIPGSAEQVNRKRTLWSYQLDGMDTFSTDPTVVDLDKDGKDDVILGTDGGQVLVLDGETGKAMSMTDRSGIAIHSPIVVADVTGDGFQDLLFMDNDAGIYRIKSNAPAREPVVWGQVYANEQHTGMFQKAEADYFYHNFSMALCGLLFLAIGFFTFSNHRRRTTLIEMNHQ